MNVVDNTKSNVNESDLSLFHRMSLHAKKIPLYYLWDTLHSYDINNSSSVESTDEQLFDSVIL